MGQIIAPALYYTWAARILSGLQTTPAASTLNAVVAWIAFEHGWHWTGAGNNPLNTTQDMPGSTAINAVGVKAYPDEGTGLTATLDTLNNGRYGAIIDALRAGDVSALWQDPAVGELDTWGGSAGYAQGLRAVYNSIAPPPAAVLASPLVGSLSDIEQALASGVNEAAKLLGVTQFDVGGKTLTGQQIAAAAVGGIVLVLLLTGVADL